VTSGFRDIAVENVVGKGKKGRITIGYYYNG